MLQQVCESLHNYFIRDSVSGQYEIAGGMISPLPFIKDGQKFMIAGSDLNDGIYTWHDGTILDDDSSAVVGLLDETFAGTICVLSVPPAVIALSEEIKSWVEKYADAILSPYSGENVIGVYSYTRATGGSGAGGSVTWQDAFAGQLKRWRKVAF